MFVRVGLTTQSTDSEGTSRGFCYPLPTRAEGAQDPKLLPGETLTVPSGPCGADFNGYSIWVWDAQDDRLLYQTDR